MSWVQNKAFEQAVGALAGRAAPPAAQRPRYAHAGVMLKKAAAILLASLGIAACRSESAYEHYVHEACQVLKERQDQLTKDYNLGEWNASIGTRPSGTDLQPGWRAEGHRQDPVRRLVLKALEHLAVAWANDTVLLA